MSAILQQLNTQPSSEPQAVDLIWYRNQNTFQRDEKKRLTGLNLCGLQLTDQQLKAIFEEEDLSVLQSLNVSENELTELVVPKEAVSLRHIDVSENASLKQFSLEGELPLLETLHATECAIERFELPAGMDQLRVLDLRKNKLTDVSLQGDCPKLESLHVGSNELTHFSLPAGFGELLYVYLLDNQIEEISFHSNLPKLRTLHLRNNQLQSLPGNLLLMKDLETLYLHNNPLPDFPKASIDSDERGNSLSGVKSFLEELNKGEIINDRVKIIIVGNGRVGKTSLFKRLKDIKFNEKEAYTHGVQLGSLAKKNLPDVKTKSLQANVWDFGGQEIFYATHQFFLSEEALYVLAWTDEDNVKEHRERDKKILPFDEIWRSREYWLENIRLHGKDSPVLMVQTHCDQKTIPINQTEYNQEPYFAECLDFSAARDYGLPKLKDAISAKLNQAIPFLGKAFPITYDSVIQEIEKERKANPTITREKFNLICSLSGINPGGEDELLSFLNRAGILVYFDVPQLKDVVYINPDWLTRQVYNLINNDLKAHKGRITTDYLKKAQAFKKYSDTERSQFLALLQRFELIFEEKDGTEVVYIAPQYLPENLEGDAKMFFDSYLEDMKPAFTFRFSKFMPDNVMINFVSRYGSSSQKIYWKHGLFLKSTTDTKGIVRYDEETKSLHVFTSAEEHRHAFQQEILQTFVELSKNADAELSLDGQVFVSWQELQKQQKLGNQNMLATDGETIVAIQEFDVLLGMGQPKDLFPVGKNLKKSQPSMNQIKQLISQGNISKALEILVNDLSGDLQDQAILLQSKLKQLNRSDRLGLLPNADLSLERNKIRAGVLELCNEAEKKTSPGSTGGGGGNPPVTTVAAPGVPSSGLPSRGPSLRTINIFLASSSELKEDRDAFRNFISVENDRLVDKHIYLRIIQWEHFLDAMSHTRLQEEYNKAIKDCDVVLSLFFTKAGKFTQEEVEKAWDYFQKTGKPLIYTYFKDAPISMGSIRHDDISSLLKFKDRLKELGHFPTTYKNMDDLKNQFKRQLEHILEL